MQIENPIRLIRELKGAPLSVLFALALINQPTNNAYLERATGYTDKPISQALAYLEEIGFVIRARSGWVLSNGAQQLPLGILGLQPGELDSPGAESRNISDSIIINRDNKLKDPEINNNNESRNISERRSALQEIGISGSKLEELEILGFDPGWVSRWEIYFKNKYQDQYSPGLVIRALEGGSHPPPAPGELDSPMSSEEKAIKYGVCPGCFQAPCICK